MLKDVPTELGLFTYPGANPELLAPRIRGFDQVKAEVIRSTRAYRNYTDLAANRRNRLVNELAGVREDSARASSSITVGKVYLKMMDQLTFMGAPQQEAHQVFLNTLGFSLDLHEKLVSHYPQYRGLNILVEADFEQRIYAELRTKYLQGVSVPSWFPGKAADWSTFFLKIANYGNYLGPNENISVFDQQPEPKGGLIHGKGIICCTFRDSLPDWFETYRGELPPKAVVEEEMESDLMEWTQFPSTGIGIARKIGLIDQEHAKKFNSRFDWRNQRVLALTALQRDFPSVLLLIDSIPVFYPKEEANLEILKRTSRPMYEAISDPANHIAKRYALIGVYDNEGLALWIESVLKESRLATSLHEPLSQYAARGLVLATGTGESEPDSQLLREEFGSNDKAFQVLNYRLRPLLMFATDDERAFLKECITQIYTGKPWEGLVWDLADVISADGQSLLPSGKDTRLLKRIGLEYQKHTIQWIRTNWQWAYQEMRNVASETGRIKPLSEAADDRFAIIIGEFQAETKEIETSSKEIAKSPYADWQIQYTTDPKEQKPGSMIVVDGETSDELAQNLADIIFKNHITCTEDPDVIIETLESIFETPKVVEDTRKREPVGSFWYKKKDKGRTRIFYTRDEATKSLIFYLYHKEDLSYRKLDK